MVQQAVKQRRGQCGVIGQRCGPVRERQVRGDDNRVALVTRLDHLEQQARLVAQERQAAEFANSRQVRPEDGAVGEVTPGLIVSAI